MIDLKTSCTNATEIVYLLLTVFLILILDYVYLNIDKRFLPVTGLFTKNTFNLLTNSG